MYVCTYIYIYTYINGTEIGRVPPLARPVVHHWASLYTILQDNTKQ